MGLHGKLMFYNWVITHNTMCGGFDVNGVLKPGSYGIGTSVERK